MAETAVPSAPTALAMPKFLSYSLGIGFVLVLSLLLFFWNLGTIPFYNKGESRESVVAWEIWNSGNWILPLRNETAIPSKPPLFHWLAVLAAKSADSLSEFTIRFPSAFLAMLGVLFTYLAAVNLWGQGAGVVSALVLATSFEWWRAATTARVDMTLTFFMLCSFVFFYFYHRAGGGRAKALFLALLWGLATLAKGPVGAILPCMTALFFLWAKRDFAFLRKAPLLASAFLFLAVAGSWYLLALWQGGERFFLRQIVHENLMTPLGGAGHNHPFYYFIPALFMGMAPWSLFLPGLAIFLYQRRRLLAEEQLLYPLIWFATVFVFFSISLGKRSVYVLPLYPAAALLIGAWWQQLRKSGPASLVAARVAGYINAFFFLLLAALLIAQVAGWNLRDQVLPHLSRREHATVLLVAQIIAENPHRLLFLSGLSLLASLVLFLGTRKGLWEWILAAMAAVTVTSLFVVQDTFHAALANRYTLKPFMGRVREAVDNKGPLFFYCSQDFGAVFYARRHIIPYEKTEAPPTPPFFLLIRREEWDSLSNKRGLGILDASEGPGQDEERQLLLVAVTEGASALAGKPSRACAPAIADD